MILTHPDIREALRERRPVVALESAVITAGLPRSPLGRTPRCNPSGWKADQPINLELARAMHRTVVESGAIPATIAVIDGALRIGIDDDQLVQFAATCTDKASINNLAACCAREKSAGTTVAATLAACTLAQPNPIRVFATGGIGGVHRDWQAHPDISADLDAMAAHPVCLISAGAKSILDLPATLEALDTRSIPVIGYRTDSFPRFHSAGHNDMNVQHCVEQPAEIAGICHAHWQSLGQRSSILIANPVPPGSAMDPDEVDRLVDEAERAATEQEIRGAARTPFLLDHLASASNGAALEANIALLLNNARLAAEIAVAITESPDFA